MMDLARWPVGSCPECYDAGTPERPRCTPHGHELLSSGATICDQHEHKRVGVMSETIYERIAREARANADSLRDETSIDVAWMAAERVLPEGWEIVKLERRGYGWAVTADNGKDQPYGVDVEGYTALGDTPAAALRALVGSPPIADNFLR